MQPTIKAYDNSTWVLDNLVGIANNFNYDSYGYGVYYDTVHGDISASNPLLVNNLLKRNTRVDRFVGTASADVDLLKMIGIDSKNHKLNYKVNLSYSKTPLQGLHLDSCMGTEQPCLSGQKQRTSHQSYPLLCRCFD